MIRKQIGLGFHNVGLIAFCQINVTIRHFEASSSSNLYLNIRPTHLAKNSLPVSLNERSYQFVARSQSLLLLSTLSSTFVHSVERNLDFF